MNQDQYIENRKALNTAIVSFVAETQDVHADSTNPFHKSKYASLSAHLAAIKPIAAKHGLAIIQSPISDLGNKVGVTTMIIHKDGDSLQFTATIPVGENINGQQAGAIYSYLRRYALAAVSGVSTDDDDAEVDRITRTAPPTQSSYIPSKPTSTGGSSSSSTDDLIVPFGKNKGQKLSELDDYNLGWWANTWEPKPWEKTGKVGPKDLALKAAAVKLWTDRQAGGQDETDEVPFD